MGGDSGGSTSSNTTSNPWVGVQDPMLDVISQAGNLYSQPYQAYQGQTIAGPSDSTVMGQNLAYQRAALGAPDLNAARGYAADLSGGAFMGGNPTANNAWLGNTAAGQNIGANPWLSSQYTDAVIGDTAGNMANAFAQGTAATNAANFARSGAYGGSAYNQKQTSDAAALAQQVGQMGNQYRLANQQLGANSYQQDVGSALSAAGQQQGAYGADVASRLQGASLAGTLSQDDWTAANAMRQQGLDQEGRAQRILDDGQNKYNAEMNFGQQSLSNYANLLSQFGGFGSQATQQQYGGQQSPLGLGVGAGLLGLSAYNAFGKGF